MLWADEGDGKHGEVNFRQVSPVQPILVNINTTGLPKGKHAVHIHAYGDMRDRCKSTGPHVRGILVRLIQFRFSIMTKTHYIVSIEIRDDVYFYIFPWFMYQTFLDWKHRYS